MQRGIAAAVLASIAIALGIAGVSMARAEDPPPAFQLRLTTDKIAGVEIFEETPGRFMTVIRLTAAQESALADLTRANVGKDLEVTLEGEPVLHVAIRGEMDTITLGPWMNEGLAKLFSRCVTRCGAKQCL
jgi:hypothetical protein